MICRLLCGRVLSRLRYHPGANHTRIDRISTRPRHGNPLCVAIACHCSAEVGQRLALVVTRRPSSATAREVCSAGLRNCRLDSQLAKPNALPHSQNTAQSRIPSVDSDRLPNCGCLQRPEAKLVVIRMCRQCGKCRVSYHVNGYPTLRNCMGRRICYWLPNDLSSRIKSLTR
jgi:hypothetical protein